MILRRRSILRFQRRLRSREDGLALHGLSIADRAQLLRERRALGKRITIPSRADFDTRGVRPWLTPARAYRCGGCPERR